MMCSSSAASADESDWVEGWQVCPVFTSLVDSGDLEPDNRPRSVSAWSATVWSALPVVILSPEALVVAEQIPRQPGGVFMTNVRRLRPSSRFRRSVHARYSRMTRPWCECAGFTAEYFRLNFGYNKNHAVGVENSTRHSARGIYDNADSQTLLRLYVM